MSSCVEDEAFSLERTAVAPNHVMLFHEQNPHTCLGQPIGANQAPDAGANYDRVVRVIWCNAKRLEFATHGFATPRLDRFPLADFRLRIRPFTQLSGMTGLPLQFADKRFEALPRN